ncbi:hypothetical protein [Streptomyces erythrochromogenes]|uniref:hypothetical protein n=1 Tax=Streptomyces erythrochromogenes TaxID=285574 RepID=UPI0036A6FCFB
MHTDPLQPLTPATRYGDPIHRPRPVESHTVLLPAEVPPGVDWVTLPNGIRTLAYTQPHYAPGGAASRGEGGGLRAWGGARARGAYAAPGVLAMAEALWATVAVIAAGGLATLLLRTGRHRGGRGAGPVQHITQNITATGVFGRATGTFNNR